MVLRSLRQLLGLRHTEHIALPRTDPSAREGWSVVAPRLAAINSSLLLISIVNTRGPIQRDVRPSLLRDGRTARDTAWGFRARTPDGSRQVTFWLYGDGALAWEKRRITIFALDENG